MPGSTREGGGSAGAGAVVAACTGSTTITRDGCDRLMPERVRKGVMRLIRADAILLDAALAGDDVLARALGHDVVAGWVTFRDALQRTRDALAADPGAAIWASRLFVTEDPPELVGWGGFKGPPRHGVVEIGYEVAEARQGRGLATAAAGAMVAEAFADERVTTVIAHTLAERNASNRVLEKVGFRYDRDVTQNGRVVWRYALTGDRERQLRWVGR